jgi:glycosyltransferase involved in cell wall biosynthesis
MDRALLRVLTPKMDHVIAVSSSIVRKLEDEGRVGAPVTLIYNGIDLERYDQQLPCCTLREEYGLPPEGPMVGVVARLEAEKGHPTLLDAWPHVLAEFPTATLLIIGEGSRREALEAQAAGLGIASSVIFTGRRDDVPAVTKALDVAVLPSYREAQGLTILEAMALSRPVVASNVGGIPEMISDGVTGLLVPPHEPVPLADAVVRLLRDHPLADTLGRAGHDRPRALRVQPGPRCRDDLRRGGLTGQRLAGSCSTGPIDQGMTPMRWRTHGRDRRVGELGRDDHRPSPPVRAPPGHDQGRGDDRRMSVSPPGSRSRP